MLSVTDLFTAEAQCRVPIDVGAVSLVNAKSSSTAATDEYLHYPIPHGTFAASHSSMLTHAC